MRKSNYGIGEALQNMIYIIKSRLLYPGTRMIRFPIYVRGKKYIDFGINLTTGRFCRIDVIGEHTSKRLIFGSNVNIGDFVSIRCQENITIGNNVLMGSRVLIIDNCHGKYSGNYQDNPETHPNERILTSGRVTIADDVCDRGERFR